MPRRKLFVSGTALSAFSDQLSAKKEQGIIPLLFFLKKL